VFKPGNVVAVFIVSKSSNTTNNVFAEVVHLIGLFYILFLDKS